MDKPSWLPDWMPQHDTVKYVNVGLTCLMLLLLGGYVVWHSVFKGGIGRGAKVAAAAAVGG